MAQTEKERLAALVEATNKVLDRPTLTPLKPEEVQAISQQEEARRASLRFPPRG